jgi:adenylate cyclase
MSIFLSLFKPFKKKKIHFFLGFIAYILVLILYKSQFVYFYTFVNRVDALFYDTILKLNLHKNPNTVKVIIIDIDDDSIQAEGRWPWPRDKFAQLLNNLKAAGVVVVGFDIVFSEAEINYARGLKEKLAHIDYPNPELLPKIISFLNDISIKVDNDQAFANSLRLYEVVLGYLFHHNQEIKKAGLPQPLIYKSPEPIKLSNLSIPTFEGYNGVLELLLKSNAYAGFVSNSPDVDAVIRHGYLLAKYDNQLYSSLALTIVMRYLLTNDLKLVTQTTLGKTLLDGVNVGGVFIPTNPQGQILIPFWDNSQSIPSFSASDILHNKIPAQYLEGSIAIVGSSLVLLGDIHESPISRIFPGVEMVANMVSGILEHQIIQEFNWNSILGIIIIVLTGLLFIIIFPFLSPIVLIIVYLVLFSLILLGAFLFLFYYKQYISVTIPLFLMTVLASINFMYDFILERVQKNKLRHLFDMYVPPSYVKSIVDNSEHYNMESENRDMSVFFGDIRNFTTLSESLDASEVKLLLNEFFTPITNIIFTHHGTIDKYVGDMVMAFWGAPLTDANHAYHALQTVLDIKSRLTEINNTLIEKKLPTVSLGMGISSGIMNVGDMGSSFRRAYTVIGDEVNLASRLQDLTKYYQVDILVSETTYLNQKTIIWRPIDKVIVKGRHKSLFIYEPLGYSEELSSQIIEELKEYEQALETYYNQDWLTAKKQFIQLIKGYPTTYLYQMYLKRIEEFILVPPIQNWDLAFSHIQK